MSVLIYHYPVRIGLTFSVNRVPNWNLPVNNADFNVYQGTDNIIEFEVKNQDRKPVRLGGRSLIMTVLEPVSRKAIEQIPLKIIDENRGLVRVIIEKPRITDWPVGFLMYSISMINVDGRQGLLFSDRDQGVAGWFEFIGGVLPEVKPTQHIMSIDWSTQTWIPPWQTVPQTMWVAQSYPGSMQDGNLEGLHTINVFMTMFTGRFFIQATLEEAPPDDPRDWFDLVIDPQYGPGKYYDQFTGIEVYNYQMHLMWLRFVWQPTNLNIPNGQIDKILFRC